MWVINVKRLHKGQCSQQNTELKKKTKLLLVRLQLVRNRSKKKIKLKEKYMSKL